LSVANAIRAVALDVDGVLTDGTFWWDGNGEEIKRFCFLDVMGISRAKRAGTVFALISGEDSPLVGRFARKLDIQDVFVGVRDKAAALRTFADRHAFPLDTICFVGDDVNDLGAMRLAGFAATPANGHATVKVAAAYVTTSAGGNGAVREVIDYLASLGRLTVAYNLDEQER
jgi:3-deoxy-D-manno-octulosonate 8-phosphate phosphatase (KDO 8-P phosphatase)